ncbi:MAG: hypothetical protein ACRCZQ_01845, partial [Bacteroidales bacterium]
MKLRFLITFIGFLSTITIFPQQSGLMQFLTLPNQQHAMYELQRPDTIPVNTIFMPLLFKGEVLPRNMKLLKREEIKEFGA